MKTTGFCRERKANPRAFYKGSFRTMRTKTGKHRVVLGCPKATATWDAATATCCPKGKACKAGSRSRGAMKVQSVLRSRQDRPDECRRIDRANRAKERKEAVR
jgi:hypothetical protein